MAYKLSERLNQDNWIQIPPPNKTIDLGKVATVFIVYGIISLITAWIFSMESEQLFSVNVRPHMPSSESTQYIVTTGQPEGTDAMIIGPIKVQRHKEVYEVSIESSLPENTWAFIEGEVQDAQKEYLFSFGEELWHETGYDDEGAWREAENHYSMKITFPQPGQYYLNLKTEGNVTPDAVQVTISKKRGSSIPHMVFGIFILLIGIVLNERRNKTFSRLADRIDND